MAEKIIDITPTPRILRTLGEIPFQPWQCLAELVDNAVDAFAEAARDGKELDEKKITVSWSSDVVAAPERAVEVLDTGLGMGVTDMQNAARAGYSSNDPVHNLGLFGMGFNIATARLGEKTRLLSAQADSDSWVGIEIDFGELIRTKSFSAPLISEPKKHPGEHGTKVVVSRLKEGAYAQLRDQETAIRRQLETIYTPLLNRIDVEVFVQGKKLAPRRHCVWGKSRYVSREGRNIPAIIEIDRDLGTALFDLERNAYLSRDEEANLQAAGGVLPSNIIERRKRLTGWVGIQRYSHPNDFGIDFVRNGRKILIGNKGLFSYENPMTGTSVLEYPVELGSTVGGRIVGELHVDYLLPVYQKNDFDRGDPSWLETVDAVRGVGPILPQLRRAMGYGDPNTSPIGSLANAYRRPDPGTKNLFVEGGTAKEFAERFRTGDAEFLSDDKWWEAAQEADRQRATHGAGGSPEVDKGGNPSDDPDEYGPGSSGPGIPGGKPAVQPPPAKPAALETSKLDELITASRQHVSWSGPYSYGHAQPLQVKAWECTTGQIMDRGESVPCAFFADGVECDFVFNPRHSFLAQFPIDPRGLLGVYLAEKLRARDNLTNLGRVYSEILQTKLQDVRIDRAALQEKVANIFDRLREELIVHLGDKATEVLECVHESSGETEETVNSMLSNGRLVLSFQEKRPEGIAALQHVPYRTLVRIVDRFTEDLFDGVLFAAPYKKIKLSDPQATQRSRNESKDRILTFMKDALWVLNPSSGGPSGGRAKDELARSAHSINFLSQELTA